MLLVKRPFLHFVFLFFLAVISAAHAQTAAPAQARTATPQAVAASPANDKNDDTQPSYISPAALSPLLLLPPPAELTDKWRKAIDDVLAIQKDIDPQDRAAMLDEQKVRLELITKVMSSGFTRERYPKSFILLDRVLKDSTFIVESDKKYWHQRRPYQTDTRVKLLVDPLDSSYTYPSGHACETRVLAEVLGMLSPPRLETLRDRADEISFHRVEAGVHYPLDIQGGQMLAMLIIGALLQNQDFRNDLAAALKEGLNVQP